MIGGVALGGQLGRFALVGVAAAVAHYATLIALVEGGVLAPTPAALCGYAVGGALSYGLSRAHVFSAQRSHTQAGWRFVVVAVVGFGLTWALMLAAVARFGAPYLPAQIATTGVVMAWNFVAHKFWTFGA